MDGKKQNFGSRSRCRFCADRAQNCHGQLQTIYSEIPKFHPNPFTSGGVIDERANIVQTRHKVFAILGEASASSPSKNRLSWLFGTSSRWKYPYFWTHPNFLITQCRISQNVTWMPKTISIHSSISTERRFVTVIGPYHILRGEQCICVCGKNRLTCLFVQRQ